MPYSGEIHLSLQVPSMGFYNSLGHRPLSVIEPIIIVVCQRRGGFVLYLCTGHGMMESLSPDLVKCVLSFFFSFLIEEHMKSIYYEVCF